MKLPFRKQPQQQCRQYEECRCEDDPRTIRKHVFIELTSKCNFNCDFCVHQFSKREKENMDLALLRKVLKDLKEVEPVDYVMFSALGEPLLHPQFGEACRLVKEFGYHLIVTTNGSLLSESIKTCPIDELYISFQTPTEKSFRHRKGGKLEFERYSRKIFNFAKNVPYPTSIYVFRQNRQLFPRFSGLLSKRSKKTISRLEQLARIINPKFAFDKCIISPLRISDDVHLIFRDLYTWSNTINPDKKRLAKAKSIPSCPYYKHHINILSNGEVTFCCMDYDGVMSLGNAKRESVGEIYSRRKINIDLACFPFCRRCKGKLV
jgi:MoaA/NifB/PqqE/SkfB family radical SAM enzyme